MASLADVALLAVETARLARKQLSKGGGLRLDLERREEPGEAEEAGAGTTIVKTLLPEREPRRLIRIVRPSAPSGRVAGVDGSSRRLNGNRVHIGVYSVAVSLLEPSLLSTRGAYPAAGGVARLGIKGPVAAVAPGEIAPGRQSLVVGEPLVNPRMVFYSFCQSVSASACKRLLDVGYGRGYDISTMHNENRILLETLALRRSASLVGNGGVVMLDGPLYVTPGLLISFYQLAGSINAARSKLYMELLYTLSYLVNLRLRLETLIGIRSNGVSIIGIVKRIGASRMLARSLGREYMSDAALVEELVHDLLGGPPGIYGAAVAVGPIITAVCLGNIVAAVRRTINRNVYAYQNLVRDDLRRLGFGDLSLEKLLSIDHVTASGCIAKRSYYLALRRRLGITIIRVEFPEVPAGGSDTLTVSGLGQVSLGVDADTLDSIVARDLDLLGIVAYLFGAGTHTLTLAPLPIHLADELAKRVTRSEAYIWFNEFHDITSFDYETLMELFGASPRPEEAVSAG